MKILIIGGTGLISTAIVKQLLARGDDVTLFNRGRTARRFEGEVGQIIGDRNDHASFVSLMHEAGHFDAVIDMAAYAPSCADSLIEAFSGRIGQLVFCSTVDVYRKPAGSWPITEAEPLESLSQYGRDKTYLEDRLHECEGFATTTIRPAATYGEGGVMIHTFGWASWFLDRLRRGMPVVVHGDGSALWSMCHIDDCAVAFVGALGNESAYGLRFHATGEWMNWNQYHQTVASAVGGPAPTLVHIPADVLHRFMPNRSSITTLNFQHSNVMDNSLAERVLGFRQTVGFAEGARRTVEAMTEFEPAESAPWVDRLIDSWERGLELGIGAESDLDA